VKNFKSFLEEGRYFPTANDIPSELAEWFKIPRASQSKFKTKNPRMEVFYGKTGQKNHVTAECYFDMEIKDFKYIDGAMSEDRRWHQKWKDKDGNGIWAFGNKTAEEMQAFLEDLAKNGIKWPVFLMMDYGKFPVVMEGNHRIAAASLLGIKSIPVNLRCTGNSQEKAPKPMDKYLDKLSG
jgi:hypothetical protein